MPRFRDLSIKAKLYSLIAFCAVCLSAVLALSLWILYEYRINGPVYDRISLRTTALAEVEPATFYTADAYLVLVELSIATDPGEIKRLTEEFVGLETQFSERESYWTENLQEGPLKTALTKDVWPAAKEFYRAARTDFLPLIGKADGQAARQALKDKIHPRFLDQREAVLGAVKKAREAT